MSATTSLCFGSVGGELLPLEECGEFRARTGSIGDLGREMVAENQNRKISDRATGVGKIPDDVATEAGPDGLDTKGVPRAFYGRARVKIGKERRQSGD